MKSRSERHGQTEVGIIIHNGHTFAALGSSVYGHTVMGYTHYCMGSISLTRWDGTTMLSCRSRVIREYHDGSVALMFRLTHARFIVGYALGSDGMLFRGELVTHCDDDQARHEAIELSEYWSDLDAEDEANSSKDDTEEPDEGDYPDW